MSHSQSEQRKLFRDRLLGGKKTFKEVPLTVTLEDGEKLELLLRQPTVADQAAVMDNSGDIDPKTQKMTLRSADMRVTAVMACAFVPGTNEKLFADTDREALLAMPAGGWFDEVAAEAMKLVNIDVEGAKKKSQETPGSDSSAA